jgi:hypothetical protein
VAMIMRSALPSLAMSLNTAPADIVTGGGVHSHEV